MKSAIFGILLVLCVGVAHATKFTVYGSGNESCGAYVAEDEEARTVDITWALGYVTAIGSLKAEAGTPMAHTDSAAIEIWLKNYCQGHPLDDFQTAVDTLTIELLGRAQ